jgi:16S rRNA (uracil1498-N3)-methyltransferase
VVQKLTELGVDRIVPFAAGRSIVRWDAVRAARHVERLSAVARAAAAQCHRARLPEVTPLASFAEVAALPGAARCDRGGAPPRPRPSHPPGGARGRVDRRGAGRRRLPTVGLVDHVLRAETAAIVAGSPCFAHSAWGQWGSADVAATLGD